MAWLAYYYLTVGLDDEGRKQAEQSIKRARDLGSPLYVMRAQSMLGTAYRHLERLEEAVTELESVHGVAKSMGFAPDEVMILYQLIRTYIDTQQWNQAQTELDRMAALATASSMQEFLIRAQWLQSLVDIHYERYEDALNNLIRASNLAEQSDSRLSQYIVQIQKSYVYHLSGNGPASRDAMVYAQKLQNRLADSLPDETARQAFLNTPHARHLQEMIAVNSKERIKLKRPVGERSQ
jgi:tetratricopeptide (TPR) repeat protein